MLSAAIVIDFWLVLVLCSQPSAESGAANPAASSESAAAEKEEEPHEEDDKDGIVRSNRR